MANKTLFQTVAGAILPKTDARNEAGGRAFALPPRHALAQYAMTGCLNATFYAGAEAQLARILTLASQVDPAFVAKTAIYCRTRGYMKDTPALLCAALTTLDVPLLERVFDRVINDGRSSVMVAELGAALSCYSVNHGAGRAKGRKAAIRELDQKTVDQQFTDLDILTNCRF